jgi:lipoyl(octanoyl) transferase
VVYPLLDLRRLGLGVRDLVTAIEQAIIAYAADFGIVAVSRRDAPGVYVGEAKLAALGLRIRRGCSYHGLALNVRMDLAPYQRINPCGYAGMAVTELTALAPSAPTDVRAVAAGLLPHLWRELRLPGAYTELREGDFEAAGDTAAAVTVAGDAAPTV